MKKIILIKSLILFTVLNVNSSFSQGVFFSEWGEGSGTNNKYLEIYNHSGAPIDLGNYSISMCVNGCAEDQVFEWPDRETFEPGTIINENEVYVICQENSISSECDQEASNNLSTGDDFMALTLAGATATNYTILDQIGEFSSFDPGSGWDVAGVSAATRDYTLIRKATVINGNTDWPSSAGTSQEDSEWIITERMTDDYTPSTLGNHQAEMSIG